MPTSPCPQVQSTDGDGARSHSSECSSLPLCWQDGCKDDHEKLWRMFGECRISRDSEKAVRLGRGGRGGLLLYSLASPLERLLWAVLDSARSSHSENPTSPPSTSSCSFAKGRRTASGMPWVGVHTAARGYVPHTLPRGSSRDRELGHLGESRASLAWKLQPPCRNWSLL